MKKTAFATIAAALSFAGALTLAASPALAEKRSDSRAERAQERVAKMIEGRTQGEPDQCIGVLNPLKLTVIEHFGIVYERGNTLWVAEVKNPGQLRRDDVPIFQRFNSQLCTNDIVRTVDRYSGFFTGALTLEKFVPYTRAERG